MNQQDDRSDTDDPSRNPIVSNGYAFVGVIVFGIFVLWLVYQVVRALFGR